ncbi:hypothetical protein B296_00021437 [Ensete ventricosum]|uniref:Uncharacterized protein n=1 Tax=Ensete ventricosum TaxID=4639 RepID=A0A427AWJ4_ENSVE|nr:hypothetical protein B296_00021437 [Ensete ventricosum]
MQEQKHNSMSVHINLDRQKAGNVGVIKRHEGVETRGMVMPGATQILATITMHIVIVMTIIMVPKAGGFKKTGVSRIRSKSYCSVLHENLGSTQKPFLFLTKVDLLDFPDPQEACNSTSRKTSPFSLGNSSSLLLHHRENHTARSHGF